MGIEEDLKPFQGMVGTDAINFLPCSITYFIIDFSFFNRKPVSARIASDREK